MITGYTQQLYILPFDHRASYISGLFGWKEPLNVEQALKVAESKRVIYEGFKKAHVSREEAGILVDEQYGIGILHDAVQQGTITAVSVEKSGQNEFDFAYGDDFAQHIEAIAPTFAKVLVRYNPEGDRAMAPFAVPRPKGAQSERPRMAAIPFGIQGLHKSLQAGMQPPYLDSFAVAPVAAHSQVSCDQPWPRPSLPSSNRV